MVVDRGEMCIGARRVSGHRPWALRTAAKTGGTGLNSRNVQSFILIPELPPEPDLDDRIVVAVVLRPVWDIKWCDLIQPYTDQCGGSDIRERRSETSNGHPLFRSFPSVRRI